AETLLSALAYLLAVLTLYKSGARSQFLWSPTILIVLGIQFVALYWLGPYRGSLRYAGIHELLSITKAVCLSSFLIVLVIRQTAPANTSSATALLVMNGAFCLLLLGGLHFGARIYNLQQTLWRKRGKRVAVVGAGDAGMSLVRELACDPNSECRPIAIF